MFFQHTTRAADSSTNATSSNSPLVYPAARRGDQVDDYHGVKVADPYRWLEDVDSSETRAWVEAENRLTFGFLEKIPQREAIRKRLTALQNYTRYGVPTQRAGRYFFTKNDGLQNQSVLYWAAALDAEPQILLDPNALSAAGTIALSRYDVSNDGRLLAYGLSTAGSDWQVWRIRDVASGKDLPDEIRWVKFSAVSWTPDNRGFYYSRYDEPNEATKLLDTNYYQKLYYHRVGTPQTADTLAYQRQDEKEWEFYGEPSEDGRYLVIDVEHGTGPKNAVFYKRLDQPDAKVIELLPNFDAEYRFLGNDGSAFYFRTDLNAPLGRVIAIDVEHPQRANWRELIPEAADAMENAGVVGDQFFISYLHDAHALVKKFDLAGHPQGTVELPSLGTVFGFEGLRIDRETFFGFTSFTTPQTIYRYMLDDGKVSLFRRPQADFNPDDYQTRQVFYASRDGTRVPMFISSKKGVPLNSENPTLLYGYGGFNISLTPTFSVANLAWMEMGGVFAMPNLRGGGEYGRAWHEAGIKLKKQNVFDDFIAAAQWLIDQHYTSTPKLAISGRSNGGLLVGACLTQRPDLFGAALPGVGVMDMLRFHKFTIGWGWTSDFGSADNPEEFTALWAYSPLHNIKPGAKYPPTLITTADHDDRVVPGHSFKFAAVLQAAQAGPAPILIRIETEAGHGAGKPTTKIIDETADEFAFLVDVLKMDPPMKP
ncbi:MAG TPA: prolyl oligopeptidase family serine peptidase [Pirellulales bacterium]|nr:prolyl oligopeptidase family serine peptidase [Pirellulales bacterium]